jgi:hypothetical protein
MSTPETKLTVETCNGAFLPAPSITFHNANREVLRITHDGRLIIGEGLSTDEATQVAAKMLVDAFEQEIQKMVDARLSGDTARLDWLEKRGPWESWNGFGEQGVTLTTSNVRDAIDKAMKEGIEVPDSVSIEARNPTGGVE